MDLNLFFPESKVKEFCLRNHIRQLSFFGSIVRDDFSSQSDIDILVEFEEGHTPGFDFFLIENELSKLLGRKVDLQTPQFLDPEIRRVALSEAVLAYEQA